MDFPWTIWLAGMQSTFQYRKKISLFTIQTCYSYFQKPAIENALRMMLFYNLLILILNSEFCSKKSHFQLLLPDSINFLKLDVISRPWPFDNESFDFVFGCLVLEHIPNLENHFEEVGRVIRSNGHLFVCELHPMKQILG